MPSKIFHIDVNSAFLSWEACYLLEDGYETDIRTIPSIVGGDVEKRHGIVLAKSIPAKEFGVKTGESIYSAKTKCPQLLSVPPHYDRYSESSTQMVRLIEEFSPTIERYSIDEVFVEISSRKGDFERIGHEIKDRIREELGFTVNVGIGDNRILAKMASDFQKPDRVHTLYHSQIQEKMWPLAVEDLFMVGRKTKEKLNNHLIYTIGDLAKQDPEYIYGFLKTPGLSIWNYANGIASSILTTNTPLPKSISNSTTLPSDVYTSTEAYRVLLALTDKVSMRLRKAGLRTQVISVGIKDYEFRYFAIEKKTGSAINHTEEIYRIAKYLFHQIWDRKPLRFFSLRAGRLVEDSFQQLSMFEELSLKKSALDTAIDEIRSTHGPKLLQRSNLLDRQEGHLVYTEFQSSFDFKNNPK